MILLPDKSGEIISASTTILYHPAPILAMGVFWYPFLRAIAISQQKKLKKYPTDKLLHSKVLSGYQPDFARVILQEPEYTIEDAKAALDKVLKGGK